MIRVEVTSVSTVEFRVALRGCTSSGDVNYGHYGHKSTLDQ